MKVFGFETDEFSATTPPVGAAESKETHGLQEVGFSLSVPS
jgi:hypothetical protein